MRVLGLRRHEDAEVIVVVRHVLRRVDPPVLLPLLRVSSLDVVEGVELDREGFAQAVRALYPLAEVIHGVRLLRVGVAQAVRGAADQAVGEFAILLRFAVPPGVGVVVRVFLAIVVRDDEREAVAAVADLVLAAALRRVRNLKDEIRLEAVPDVDFSVPPHRAGALRVRVRRPALVAPLHELPVDALLRLGQAHHPLRGVGVVEDDVGVANEPQVVLHALILVRRGGETADRRRRGRAVLAREVRKVELDVEPRAVLARADRLRVPVVAHDADDPLLAVGDVVVLHEPREGRVVRLLGFTRRDGRRAAQDGLLESGRHAREVVLVLVDRPRHGLAHGREVVVGRVRTSAAVVVATRVQIQVVVHRVHGDPQVVVGVVRLDVVVPKLLRLHDGRHAEAAAPRVDLAVLVRPRLIKRVLRVRQVRQRRLVRREAFAVRGEVRPGGVVVVHAVATTGRALQDSVVEAAAGRRRVDRLRVVGDELRVGDDARDADVLPLAVALAVGAGAVHHEANDVSRVHVRGELRVAVPVRRVLRGGELERGDVVLHEAGGVHLRASLRGGGRGRVRRDREALAVVVAHRRVRVVVRDEALALGGDPVLAVLDVRDVDLPLVKLYKPRRRHRARAHGDLVPLDVHAKLLLELRVFELEPRAPLHRDAAVRVRGDHRFRALVVRAVSVAVVRVLERLPPHVVLELRGRARGGLRDDDLHRDPARPERHEAGQTADVQVVRFRRRPGVCDELAVAERERSVDRELDVGLDRVHHPRLPARGDREAGAKLREKPRVPVQSLRRALARGVGELGVGPHVRDDAFAVGPHAAVALREHRVPVEVRRLEQRLGEGVFEVHDVLGVRPRRREVVHLDRLPVAVDLHGHPRAFAKVSARLSLRPVRRLPHLRLEARASSDDAVLLERRRAGRAVDGVVAPSRRDRARVFEIRGLIRVRLDEAHAGGAFPDARRARHVRPVPGRGDHRAGVRQAARDGGVGEGEVGVHGELRVRLDRRDDAMNRRRHAADRVLVEHDPVPNLQLLRELARVRRVGRRRRREIVPRRAHDGELLLGRRVGEHHLGARGPRAEAAAAARRAERERNERGERRGGRGLELDLGVGPDAMDGHLLRDVRDDDDHRERVGPELRRGGGGVDAVGGVAAELLRELRVLPEDDLRVRVLLDFAVPADHVRVGGERVALGVIALERHAVAARGVRVVAAPGGRGERRERARRSGASEESDVFAEF
eukprot:29197-Pelagococcus_subviridis.AAC.7